MKNGNGAFKVGAIDGVKPDATFIMLDADFANMSSGGLKPQEAFMQGKMKIRGNMKAAMKFTPDVLPKDEVPEALKGKMWTVSIKKWRNKI